MFANCLRKPHQAMRANHLLTANWRSKTYPGRRCPRTYPRDAIDLRRHQACRSSGATRPATPKGVLRPNCHDRRSRVRAPSLPSLGTIWKVGSGSHGRGLFTTERSQAYAGSELVANALAADIRRASDAAKQRFWRNNQAIKTFDVALRDVRGSRAARGRLTAPRWGVTSHQPRNEGCPVD
jgi:hypothetical protein